jgi:aminocarboxymuconate-semialdehyde decarboxylase
MPEESLVDVHTHFFPRQLLSAIERRSEPPCVERNGDGLCVRFGPGRRYPLTTAMGDADAKVAGMDRSGITHSILSVNMPGVDGLGEEAVAAARQVNDGMREAAESRPDRLSWMAVVPMERPGEVAAELRRCVACGARAVMIGSNVAGRPLDLDTDAGLFETAHELEIPIMVHPAFPLASEMVSDYELTSILGFPFDTTTAALRLVLAGMFDRYPRLKFVVSHVGGMLPFLVGRIDYLSMKRQGGLGRLSVAPSDHLRKLYVDGVCLWPPALRLGVEFFGAGHVMFGSDDPYWPMCNSIETFSDAGLAAADRRMVAHGTAAAVMGVGAPARVAAGG